MFALSIKSRTATWGLSLLAAAVVMPACLAWAIGASPARADAPDVRAELRCLALNAYFEARGEPDRGKIAVSHVVMNRVESDRYPDDVCAVVKQGGEDQLHRCQFSWWCDGKSDEPRDADAWEHSKAIAQQVYWHLTSDPTGGALWYHARYVAPKWRTRFARGPVIGDHIFYLPTRQLASISEPVAQSGPAWLQ